MESDLISRAALLDEFVRLTMYNDHGKAMFEASAAEHKIHRAPAIDAVQVVRCKDCRYAQLIYKRAWNAFDPERVRDCTNQRGDYKPVYHISVVDAEGYCDEGERKDAPAREGEGGNG